MSLAKCWLGSPKVVSSNLTWDEIVTHNVDKVIDPPFQEVHYGPVVNEPGCGKRTVARRRVVGGSNAGFGTYPWQVGIFNLIS